MNIPEKFLPFRSSGERSEATDGPNFTFPTGYDRQTIAQAVEQKALHRMNPKLVDADTLQNQLQSHEHSSSRPEERQEDDFDAKDVVQDYLRAHTNVQFMGDSVFVEGLDNMTEIERLAISGIDPDTSYVVREFYYGGNGQAISESIVVVSRGDGTDILLKNLASRQLRSREEAEGQVEEAKQRPVTVFHPESR